MKPVRSLPDAKRRVLYLTFDDGPHPESTASVLNVLARHQVRATFFVIATKAQTHPQLLHQIRDAGHGIGNHSLDHGYAHFFLGKRSLRKWIETSELALSQFLGEATIGFRPPAGVRTPELHSALKSMKMPLVLWNTRFFDTVFSWTRSRAFKSLKKARSGDIILLHDRQPLTKLPLFLETLDAYLSMAKETGFEFDVLTRTQLEGDFYE